MNSGGPVDGGVMAGAMQAIGRRPWAWCAAVLAAAFSLAALLVAACGLQSLRPWIDQGGLPAQATVILAPGTADADAVRAALLKQPAVASVSFVGRDAALARLAARSPADREAIAQLAINPLPDSYIVEFRADAEAADLEASAAAMRKLPRVDTVQLELGWYRKLRASVHLGAPALAALAALVAGNALLWLLAAIGLGGQVDPARARLLSLLGADARSIAAPAAAAGAIAGAATGAVAIGLARLALNWLDARASDLAALYSKPMHLPWPDASWLAAGAVILGLAGAGVASIGARMRLRRILAPERPGRSG